MRTTIEITPEHRVQLAAQRGMTGCSKLGAKALDARLRAEADRAARRERAIFLGGGLPAREAEVLRRAAEALRRS